MKKNQLASLYIVVLCLLPIGSFYLPQVEAKTSMEATVIPNEAIRLRILANSDSSTDQRIKREIRDEVNVNITEWVADLTSLDEARKVIKSHIGDIEKTAESYVQKHGVEQTVKVEFGPAKFPTKLYGQYLYPAGEYEAIVITLGEGSGANWWCVLFPPLCFLDFANGTAVSMTPMEDDEMNEVNNTALQLQADEEIATTATEHLIVEEKQEISDTREENEIAEEEEEESELPVYVDQDEAEEVIEKKIFVKEVWDNLFSKE